MGHSCKEGRENTPWQDRMQSSCLRPVLQFWVKRADDDNSHLGKIQDFITQVKGNSEDVMNYGFWQDIVCLSRLGFMGLEGSDV